jgi:hypothetical protein
LFEAGRSKGQTEGEQIANANHYADSADRQIERYCAGLESADAADCIRAVVEAANEDQRAESDLVAQKDAARWGFGSLIVSSVGAIISMGALAGLFISLGQTKQAIRDTREIGEAQVRAYLSLNIVGIVIDVINNEDGTNLAVKIDVRVVNSGSTPAYSPVIYYDIQEAAPNDVVPLAHPETMKQSPLRNGFISANGGSKTQLSRVFQVDDPAAFQTYEGRLIRFSYCINFLDEFDAVRWTPVISGTFHHWPKGKVSFLPDKIHEAAQG